MNILLLNNFFVGFLVSEIPRVFVGTIRIRLFPPTYINIIVMHILELSTK